MRRNFVWLILSFYLNMIPGYQASLAIPLCCNGLGIDLTRLPGNGETIDKPSEKLESGDPCMLMEMYDQQQQPRHSPRRRQIDLGSRSL